VSNTWPNLSHKGGIRKEVAVRVTRKDENLPLSRDEAKRHPGGLGGMGAARMKRTILFKDVKKRSKPFIDHVTALNLPSKSEVCGGEENGTPAAPIMVSGRKGNVPRGSIPH